MLIADSRKGKGDGPARVPIDASDAQVLPSPGPRSDRHDLAAEPAV